MIRAYVMTIEQAMKFFQKSMEKEAVTREERLQILGEMEKSGDVLFSMPIDATEEEVKQELKENYNVIEIRNERNRDSKRDSNEV